MKFYFEWKARGKKKNMKSQMAGRWRQCRCSKVFYFYHSLTQACSKILLQQYQAHSLQFHSSHVGNWDYNRNKLFALLCFYPRQLKSVPGLADCSLIFTFVDQSLNQSIKISIYSSIHPSAAQIVK